MLKVSLKKLVTFIFATNLFLLTSSQGDEIQTGLSYAILVQHEVSGGPAYYKHPRRRGTALPDPQLMEILSAAGFTKKEVLAFSPDISVEYLKKFNLVIIGGGGGENTRSLNSVLGSQVMEHVFNYVKAGGGLLFLRGPSWQHNEDIKEYNKWLEGTGIKILDEQIVDSQNYTNLESGGPTLYWTNNISQDHKDLFGIEGLFYPASYGFYRDKQTSNFTSPIEITGNEWTTIVSGMSTAYSIFRDKDDGTGQNVSGTIEKAPPFLAVRDFEQGRIGVMPIASSCIWQDSFHRFWDDGIVVSGKRDGMISQGSKLMVGLFKHLSEPSVGLFAGYSFEEEVRDNNATTPYDFNVPFQNRYSHYPKDYVGLIGAMSKLSSGCGTPEEFIDEAMKAGYDFIAFTEDLEYISKDDFDKLKDICKDKSNNTFKAYAGLKYKDQSGNSWVTFSNKLLYPKDAWFSSVNPKCLKNNFTPAQTWDWPPIILLHPNINREKAWFQGNFNGLSLFTYDKKGGLIDDAREVYFRLLGNRFMMTPASIHLVTSPQKVAAARNKGFQTHVRLKAGDNDYIKAFEGTGFGIDRSLPFRPVYVSEGPVIEDSRIVPGAHIDLTPFSSSQRERLHIGISSKKGLKEVTIRDSDKQRPWRRYLPKCNYFEKTIDFFHDKQRELIITVKDNDGNEAIGWCNNTTVIDNNFLRSTDNYYTMPRGKWWGEPDGWYNTRGLENYLVGRDFEYSGSLQITNNEIKDTIRPAIEFRPQMASRFCSIVETKFENHYPPTTSGGAVQTDKPELAEKNKFISGSVKYSFYPGSQGDPVAVLVEGKFKALKGFTASALYYYKQLIQDADFISALQKEGSEIKLFEGNVDAIIDSQNNDWIEKFLPETGYVAIAPLPLQGSVGIIPLVDGYRYWLQRDQQGQKELYLLDNYGPYEFNPGDEIIYKYIMLTGKLGDESTDVSFLTKVRDSLVLSEEPAYFVTPLRIEDEQIGEVENRSFVLKLKAHNYGFAGTISEADLPIPLPVSISGLNPRWDAGILYKGEETLSLLSRVTNSFGQAFTDTYEKTVKNEILRFGVLEDGTGHLQIDTSIQAKDIFIGNFLRSDNLDVHISLAATSGDERKFTVHNPTDGNIICTITPVNGFDLYGTFSEKVTVPAGSTIEVQLDSRSR